MESSSSSPSASPSRKEEPDAELTELVESLQKIQAVQRPAPQVDPAFERTLQYVNGEIASLRGKQATIQEQIEKKNKEIATLRETLLIVNGALQGMQHIHSFMNQGATQDSSSSSPEEAGP